MLHYEISYPQCHINNIVLHGGLIRTILQFIDDDDETINIRFLSLLVLQFLYISRTAEQYSYHRNRMY